jgi:1-acyl-sn-glycerol-3-phosphate acyltransferase
MKKIIALIILKILGWKIVAAMPEGLRRGVLIVAPHTSNWDFVIGRLFFMVLGIKSKFLIKKESFEGLFGYILKQLGGIPVDRKNSNNVVNDVAHLFRDNKELVVIITPEGTRKLTKNWKKGYYYIAELAKVPVIVSFIDYKKKEGGIAFVFKPTGDYEKDFQPIKELYLTKQAKYPEMFSLSPMYQEKK